MEAITALGVANSVVNALRKLREVQAAPASVVRLIGEVDISRQLLILAYKVSDCDLHIHIEQLQRVFNDLQEFVQDHFSEYTFDNNGDQSVVAQKTSPIRLGNATIDHKIRGKIALSFLRHKPRIQELRGDFARANGFLSTALSFHIS